MRDFLSLEQTKELRTVHKKERSRRNADRIRAILLLDSGWTCEQVAEVLLLDDQTIRNYEATYRSKGIDGLLFDNYIGCIAKLTADQEERLKEHLRTHLYRTAKEMGGYVRETFGVSHTPEGIVHTLHRLGFVYKKTTPVPGKANPQAQQEFLAQYQHLKETKTHSEKIFFIDGVHPHYNSMPAYSWIEKGATKELPTNTGRERINLNGALDTETHEIILREDKSINAQSTIELLGELQRRNPQVSTLYVIADNARYYRAKAVREYFKDSSIQLLFLPAYSPNLNLIERVWRFFYEKTLYNKYYDMYQKFKTTCLNFFQNISLYREKLRTLLAENFQIIGT
ncbi:MAG: IS630 family transposase [Candidatus Jettenia sp. CY-1]|nr:MAG: IS630 family transposase [Candidatus Jettenia sp. CY-1]